MSNSSNQNGPANGSLPEQQISDANEEEEPGANESTEILGFDLFAVENLNELEQVGGGNNDANEEEPQQLPPVASNAHVQPSSNQPNNLRQIMDQIDSTLITVPSTVAGKLMFSYFNPNLFKNDSPNDFFQQKCMSIADEFFQYGLEKWNSGNEDEEVNTRELKKNLNEKVKQELEKLTRNLDEHEKVAENEKDIKKNADEWITRVTGEGCGRARTHYEAIKRKNKEDGLSRLDRNDTSGYTFTVLDKVFMKKTDQEVKDAWEELKECPKKRLEAQDAVSKALTEISLVDFCKGADGIGEEKENWLDAFVALNACMKVVDVVLEECFKELHNKFKEKNPDPFTEEEENRIIKMINDFNKFHDNIGERTAVTNNFVNDFIKLKGCFEFFKSESADFRTADMAALFHKVMVLAGSSYPKWWDKEEGKYQMAVAILADKQATTMSTYDATKAAKFFRTWNGSVEFFGRAGLKAFNDLRMVRNRVAHASSYKLKEKDRKAAFYTFETIMMAFSKANVENKTKLKDAIDEANKTLCMARTGCFKVKMDLAVRESFCCAKEAIEKLQEQWKNLGGSPSLGGFDKMDDELLEKIYPKLSDLWKRAYEMSFNLLKLKNTDDKDHITVVGKQMLKAMEKTLNDLQESIKAAEENAFNALSNKIERRNLTLRE